MPLKQDAVIRDVKYGAEFLFFMTEWRQAGGSHLVRSPESRLWHLSGLEVTSHPLLSEVGQSSFLGLANPPGGAGLTGWAPRGWLVTLRSKTQLLKGVELAAGREKTSQLWNLVSLWLSWSYHTIITSFLALSSEMPGGGTRRWAILQKIRDSVPAGWKVAIRQRKPLAKICAAPNMSGLRPRAAGLFSSVNRSRQKCLDWPQNLISTVGFAGREGGRNRL